MVTVGRVEFGRKLSAMASVQSSTSKRYPLLGLVQDGSLRLWQDGDMPVWKSEEIDTDENFFFSVPTGKLKEIVSKFQGSSIDLLSDNRGSLIIQSGRSSVSVPYMEGVYDEIPTPPTLQLSCKTDPTFVSFLAKSKDFCAKTFDQEGLIYTFIGSIENQFLISGTNGFSAFTSFVPYIGDEMPDVVVPTEFAVAASKLVSGDSDVCMGISENRGHVVISNEDTTIYTPRVQREYPTNIIKLALNDGVRLFDADRQEFISKLKIALQTTSQDLIGVEPNNEGGITVTVPRSSIGANLVIEDAKIVTDFDITYFQLPFLIQSLSAVLSERVNIDLLPDFNGAFRISREDTTAAATVLPHIITSP